MLAMMQIHPDREQVVQEMLLRRFPNLSAPTTLVQIVRILSPEDRAREAEMVTFVPHLASLNIMPNGRHADGLTQDGTQFLWERQSEASTVSLVIPGLVGDAATTSAETIALIAWIEGLPGMVVRATRALIIADEQQAEQALRMLDINSEQSVTCRINGCRIWSEFKLYSDTYGRMLVAANTCLPADLGRVVQNIQELGNYRNLALLGLPLARKKREELDLLEAQLSEYALDVSQVRLSDETILAALSRLSAELAHLSSSTAFRMNATAAYAAIVHDRLQMLPQERIPGQQNLSDFTDRRLTPAIRTCDNFGMRLDQLEARSSRITALLRTRIETRIEKQNGDLLSSMEQGIALQVRSNNLVEGLSFLALSYYAVGLIAYVIKGANNFNHGIKTELLIAASVLPISGIIYAFLRWQKTRLKSVI
jgi:uncharacterized membrane-anchored protein